MRFAGKIEEADLPGGVLVTLSPVSGSDDQLTAARAELDKFRAKGHVIVVLSEANSKPSQPGIISPLRWSGSS